MLECCVKFTTLCGLSLALLACQNTDNPPVSDTSQPQTSITDTGTPIEIGRSYNLKSKALGMDRTIAVRLPLGYDKNSETRYPVVYVVDGGPEQDFPHIAGIVQSRDMNWTFAPFILVGLETVNRRHQIVPPATDIETYEAELGAKPGGSAKFRDFIRDDVMAWVNTRYRTTGHDVIMGESLAGLFVVETLFEEPTLFDDYIAVTPSLWWEDMKYGREAGRYLANLPEGKRRLILTSADEGYRHQGGIDLLVKSLQANTHKGLLWAYHARGKQETHGSVYHLAALEAFRDLFPMTTTYGRAGSLLSGTPLNPRTEQQDAQLKTFEESCTIDTALQATPEKFIGKKAQPYSYHCILLDYGDKATAGNMERLSHPGAVK